MMENPFRPSAGSIPHEIIGRSGLLDEFDYGLSLGAGAPGLFAMFRGARGTGKTVMLGVAQAVALEHGWSVISETASRGFVARIAEKMRQLSGAPDVGASVRRAVAVTREGFSDTRQLPLERQEFMSAGEEFLRLLHARGKGLVITVDEIQAADRSELAQLEAGVQQFVMNALPIGLVAAGLPAGMAELLNEGGGFLLRETDRIDLRAVAVHEVARSFEETFAAARFQTTSTALRRAAEATEGYPFLIQVVGYFMWREAENNNGILAPTAVDRAIERARNWNAKTVVAATLSKASERDVEFLRAMAEDDGPSTARDIGRRMVANPTLVANYRRRLIAKGIIRSVGHGKVDLAIPGLRRYLRAMPTPEW